MADADDKTEEATPEKERKAREEGQFPRAQDAGGTAASLAVVAVLGLSAQYMAETIRDFTVDCLKTPNPGEDWARFGDAAMGTLTSMVLPGAGAAAMAAVAIGIAQAGFHPHMELAAPKWSRLDPIARMKNMFSPKSATVTTSLSLFRVISVAAVAYLVTKDSFAEILRVGQTSLGAGVLLTLELTLQLSIWASLAMAVLAMLDYAYNVFKHKRDIRMSIQELKDEMKQAEGSPEMRMLRRQKARELATKGLVQAITDSDVVVVNPTHYAVALRYKPTDGAPVVTAKGIDEVALYMRQIAEKNDVPVVENIPLARGLSAVAKVDKVIPADFYGAVAEVLAFVYRLKNRRVMA